MSAFVDPRVRMRDALRMLVQQREPAWDEPSLTRFRNLLLDETGSDARPLADLLLEAIRRGWRDQLASGPMEPARWDAITSPFVMRWSTERFVQLEMARWAAESWGFALGVIGVEQLRVAPPPAPVTVAPAATPRTNAPTPASSRTAVTRGVPPTGLIGTGGNSAAASGSATANANARSASHPLRASPRPAPVPMPSVRRTTVASSPHAIPHLNPKLVRNLAIAAAAAYLLFIVRMVVSIRADRRAAAAMATAVPADTLANTLAGAGSTSSSVAGTGDSVVARADAPRAKFDGADAPAAPPTASLPAAGVPSITRNALPGATNDGRMLIVEPARRASGSSAAPASAALTPTRKDPVAYDELQLNDGSRMTGRVDIIRAGVVIFRDMRTGLRHEISKDDIEQIITEFGTPVRFRALNASAPVPGASPAPARSVKAAAVSGVRARGVAGRFAVRYEAAVAKGSKECTSVWTRSPQTVDYATVSHVPGADTLTVAFDGGDNFPSNVDQDGFFASTPRVMPDQARTSTALVTRLNGRFPPDGSLSLTVSIVFFRRMRAGPDLACTVYVNGTGTRLPR